MDQSRGRPPISTPKIIPRQNKLKRFRLRNISAHSAPSLPLFFVQVEIPPWHSTLARLFLEAGGELGYPVSDPAGPRMDGFSLAAATMRNGRRCSTAKAFLRPAQTRKNLHISKRSRATRVIMQGKQDDPLIPSRKFLRSKIFRKVWVCARDHVCRLPVA